MVDINGNVSTNPLELAKIDGLVLQILEQLKALRPVTNGQASSIQAANKNLTNWCNYDLEGLKIVFKE